jgi:NAD(P)-dependent dehydrogenase (short-subunit alcohol dehydrogenase family)
MSRVISGKVVAVTGAGRGIGAAIAQELSRRGALVALGDIDAAAAARAAAGLGPRAAAYPLDVTDLASFINFVDTAEHDLGPVDVLVNNAGVMWVGPADEEHEQSVRRQFDVNVHGVVTGMQIAIRRMRQRGHGHIINIASIASLIPPPGEATYCATKHAVYGYSATVRRELAGTGVTVSVVLPSVVETGLARSTSAGLIPRLRPEEVATAVADLVRRPRFEAFVPRRLNPMARALALLPQRGRDVALRLMVPDQAAATDQAARAEYERAAGLVGH